MNALNKMKNKKVEGIDDGVIGLIDYIAPGMIKKGIGKDEVDFIRLNNTYIRNFTITGYPNQVNVTWLDKLFNGKYDIDTSINIIPCNDELMHQALTAKITQYTSQLEIERQKGNVKNVTRYQDILDELYAERRKLEKDIEKFFQIQINFNLCCKDMEILDKETQLLTSYFRGRNIKITPTYMRQSEGFYSVAPIQNNQLPDMYRNANSGAVTSCFPFYNSEFLHKNGVYLGVNALTMSPSIIDFYDKKIFTNANISVIGQAGMGKSFFVSLLTMRSALNGITSAIIDAEGEYRKITEALGGRIIELSAESSLCLNPFDIEEEDILDDDNVPTGFKTVNINDKVSDVLNLIEVMVGGMSGGMRSTCSKLLQQLYYDRGITNEPKSLYVSEPSVDLKNNKLIHNGLKKKMPRLSDFHTKLYEFAIRENNKEAKALADTLTMFLEGGIYGMFDCYTDESLENIIDVPIITFDVSALEDKILRPIGMYVSMTWIWEKFIKKNPMIFKRVVCDEAWMLVSKSMAGNQYSAAFLENIARRIRKYNGGLLVASQNFSEFNNSEQGKTVLKQAATKIFLGQDPSDIEAIKDMFKLSDGETNVIMQAPIGQLLLKSKQNSAVVNVLAFEEERKLIEKPKINVA